MDEETDYTDTSSLSASSSSLSEIDTDMWEK